MKAARGAFHGMRARVACACLAGMTAVRPAAVRAQTQVAGAAPVAAGACAEGRSLQEQGRYTDALRLFRAGLSRDRAGVCAYKGYLECTRMIDPVGLLSLLRGYIIWRHEEPGNVAAQYALAKTYGELHRWKRSMHKSAGKGAVPDALEREASAYMKEFRREMEHAVGMAPGLVYPYYDLLDWAEAYGQREMQFELLRRILELAPDDLDANLRMMTLCARHIAVDPRTARPEMVAAAIRYARRVLDLDPGNPTAWYRLGYAHQMSGRYEKAIEYYGRCLELEKEPHSKRAQLCRFWIGEMTREMREGTERPLIPLEE
jgi:tetratricopeptide (TPR) repeat protein